VKENGSSSNNKSRSFPCSIQLAVSVMRMVEKQKLIVQRAIATYKLIYYWTFLI
jgi:hypothetical protein